VFGTMRGLQELRLLADEPLLSVALSFIDYEKAVYDQSHALVMGAPLWIGVERDSVSGVIGVQRGFRRSFGDGQRPAAMTRAPPAVRDENAAAWPCLPSDCARAGDRARYGNRQTAADGDG
jgi:hypothetical protein